MKRKALLTAVMALVTCLALVACANKTPDKQEPRPEVKYTVTYAAGDGTGSAPSSQTVVAGTTVTLAQNTFTYEGHTFDGWTAGGNKYAAGDSYTVNADTVFTATWKEDGGIVVPPEVKYTVSYAAGDGTGSAPSSQTVVAGATVTLAQNTFTYEGHTFDGWTAGGNKYNAGDSYTVNADTVFTAAWKQTFVPPEPVVESQPSFSQSRYVYDRLGGGDLELPFELDGSKLYYVRVDEQMLGDGLFVYDDESGAIVIECDYVLDLALGSYTVTAITDSRYGDRVCTVDIVQSLKTTFDDVTDKHFTYGVDSGVKFDVGFNRTTPVKLTQGDVVVPSEYYSYDATGITVAAEWLAKSSTGRYTLELSNHDRYKFTVTSNIIFATDYDLNTIHSTVMSNVGLNPLYQYYDEVSLTASPSEMNSGRALKITPYNGNLDCYITLRTPECSYTWYELPFRSGKTYYITFDYMTKNTRVGDLLHYSGTDKNTIKQVGMLVGPSNDDTVHRFEALYSYDEIGLGVRINARFATGGELYVDNYRIVELDAAPTAGAGEYDANGDYKLTFDAQGYSFDVALDGTDVDFTYSAGANTLTLAADVIAALSVGEHAMRIHTPVGTLTHVFRVLDTREASFAQSTYEFRSRDMTELKVTGSFEQSIELLSLKQKAKFYDNGYTDWNFTHDNDTTTNFASLVTLTAGDNGSGYITMPKAFLDKFWGEVTFVAEFDNGNSAEFTVNIPDVLMFTNYEESNIFGYIFGDDIHSWTPFSSGLNGETVIEEREPGNNAYYIYSSVNSADNTVFTSKYMEYTYDWYRVIGNVGDCYRVTFDYQVSGFAQGDVYFDLFFADGEDVYKNYFGENGTVVGNELWRYLIADGQVHTFDSGWFTHNTQKRLSKINFPAFDKADGKFMMFDNYRVIRTAGIGDLLGGTYEYDTYNAQPFTLDVGNETVTAFTVDGSELAFTQQGSTLSVATDVMTVLSLGTHTLVLKTDEGIYRNSISVVYSLSLAELTDTTVQYSSLSQTELKVYGSFTPDISLTSLKQKAKFYNGGYSNWNFTYLNDTTTNFASFVTLTNGENGTGYLTMPKSFLDKFWGEVTFVAEFSNGQTVEFTVVSADVMMFTNYDESTLMCTMEDGRYNSWSPMSSGLQTDGLNIEDRGNGNKALYLRASGGVDTTLFTTKYMEYSYDWYKVIGSIGDSYRVTFEYQVSGLSQGDVYFELFFADNEDINANYYGEGGTMIGGNMRFYLVADGQVHTFDSGWFTHNAQKRLSKINFPTFAAADGRFIMIDDYRVVRKAGIPYILSGVDSYTKGKTVSVSFDAQGQTVASVKIGERSIGFAQSGNTVTLDGDDLASLDCDSYTLVVITEVGTYRKTFAVLDERKSVLIQTSESVVRGQNGTVKLVGEFDPTLTVLGVKRKGADEWDTSRVVPVDINKNYVTVASDGLTLSSALVDSAYGTTVYYVTFDNGQTVEFELISNLLYYTDYDETTLFETNQGNVGTTQDTAMWHVVGDGNCRLEYAPSNTSQGHSWGAINGGGADNGVFTFSVEGRNSWWKRYVVPSDREVIISFDYEIVTAGKNPNFTFVWFGNDNARNEIRLLDSATGASGTFYIEIPAGQFSATYICCPAATPDDVAGCMMYIDNYYFGLKMTAPTDGRTAYISQNTANVVYGQSGDVKFDGAFDTTLTVKSFTRSGTDEWDPSRTVPAEISAAYIVIAADGLTVKRSLIDQAYGTTTYVITFDNDKRVEFKLTSNLMFFTNYDDTYIFDTRGGNMPSCQDAALWGVVEDADGRHLEYRPERAVEWHSVQAINGGGDANAIFTYKSTSRGDINWMSYNFAAGQKMVFFFDYEIVNPNNAEHNMTFCVRRRSDEQMIVHKIDGSGKFELTVDYEIDTMMLRCDVSSPDKVSGVCMKIDNFGFGITE